MTTLAWARKSQSQARLNAMIELAKSEPGVPINADQFDAHKFLLNVRNGTIDLQSGALRSHQKGDLISRVIPLDFDPDAPCPTWLKFLGEVTGGDSALESFLQQACGYAATGETSEQCLFLLYGSGANGKSTFLNAIRHVLGPYARQTPTEALLAKAGGGGIPSDIARLRGARFVTASEVDDGRRMAEGLVKELTGGEPVTARYLYGEWFEFVPTFKLFLGPNHRPHLNGCDPAIWR